MIGRDVFTESERRYMYSLKPPGFLRAWHAAYESRCHGGPWTISRRRMVYGAIERGNRLSVGHTSFDGFWGWHVSIPVGFGTVALWGYVKGDEA